MEQEGLNLETQKFASPEEELQFLREQSAQKELLWQETQSQSPESAISATVTEYGKSAPAEKLEEHLLIENPQFEAVVEHIGSVPHREKMREIYHVLAEKGVLNAIKITQALNNPHIEDDFHRVLVEYIRTGAIVPGLEKERNLATLLSMTLFEVTLPFAGMHEGEKILTFKEVIYEMERFYLGMIPLEGAAMQNYGHFTLELVLSNFSNDIVFYVGVEKHMKDLFMRQILGAFPSAHIEEHPGDYNIFNEFGASVASYGEQTDRFSFPIKYGDESDQDPFTVILNSFTKIERDGEGVAIQLVVYPDSNRVLNKVKHALAQIKEGVPVKAATDIPLSVGADIYKSIREFVRTEVVNGKHKEKTGSEKDEESARRVTELVEEKISAPLLMANLRLVVSAQTRERAEAIRSSIESSYNQFSRPHGNGIKFVSAQKGRLQTLLHDFTYRSANDNEAIVLNTKELATLYHLPVHVSQKDAPQLKTVSASSAPAPQDLPSEGTLLGINKYRGESREIRMTKADRVRHLYMIGQTGVGKTTLFKNMIVEDIKAGHGVCYIDPHGTDIQDILANIPKERIEDVIYFDPSYTPRPFALNMLEYDINKPEQKIFVVNELFSIFKKLYSSTPESMGPAFEQYFRNATMLVLEDPETGMTMLEISRVMADKNFRALKLSRCKNPIVVQFWKEIAEKTSGEAGLANMIPYITNKFDIFLSNDVMRPIIAQEKSSFNFRDIMDNKKIILVNLAKGKLGEINSNLIGLVLVGKILMAALSRVDSYGKTLPDFYLYIDEFQNISTDSISSILSEARKYGLSLNIAHQFIAQLEQGIKDSVFGNVGSIVAFRVGAEDAQFLESQFAPIFKASDLMRIENRNAYLKMLINGKPVPAFNIETLPPPQGRPEIVESIKSLSYLKFGKDRKTVDDAIMKKYLAVKTGANESPTQPPPPSTPRSIVPAPAPQVTPPPAVIPASIPPVISAPFPQVPLPVPVLEQPRQTQLPMSAPQVSPDVSLQASFPFTPPTPYVPQPVSVPSPVQAPATPEPVKPPLPPLSELAKSVLEGVIAEQGRLKESSVVAVLTLTADTSTPPLPSRDLSASPVREVSSEEVKPTELPPLGRGPVPSLSLSAELPKVSESL